MIEHVGLLLFFFSLQFEKSLGRLGWAWRLHHSSMQWTVLHLGGTAAYCVGGSVMTVVILNTYFKFPSKQVDYNFCTEVADSTNLSNSIFLSGFQLTTSHVYAFAHLCFHTCTPTYMYPYLTQCESHTSPMRRYRLPSFSNDLEDSEQKEVEEFSLSKVPSSLLKQVGGLLQCTMLLIAHKLHHG